jgi:hypothetical protein
LRRRRAYGWGNKETDVRTLITLTAGMAALTLSACNSPQDQAAERKADALEAQAAATPNEAREKALNAQADAIEQQAGNADAGATTANTPDTSPSK